MADLQKKQRSDAGPHVGKTFGAWFVEAYLGNSKNGRGAVYRCRCKCGSVRDIDGCNLVSGKTKSCGCQKAGNISMMRTAHGHAARKSSSPTYSTWSSMIQRCTNERNARYGDYGGRGIRVCERWNSFECFLADMGEKPSKGMSIERLDTNGNYEPGNCVWADAKTQARNTRRTKLTKEIVGDIQSGGLSVRDVVAETGCSKSTFYAAKSGRNWS